MTRRTIVRGTLIITASLLIALATPAYSASTRDYAVEITAEVAESPPEITLRWRPLPGTLNLWKKTQAATAWSFITSLPSGTAAYTDSAVATGQAYEYALTKQAGTGNRASGYIYAGIRAPLVEQRGKILLLVDASHAAGLHFELARLQQDLVGDGWTVVRRDISRSQSPQHVRWVVQSEYNADPANVKAVFLLGHLPVPYSGNFEADEHWEHKGAWAADVYYADVNGRWTDSSVNNTTAARRENRNVPGDGKLDQSVLPSDVELQIGRVDLAKMPAFLPKSERELLRQYLNKNHNYRHGRIYAERRGIIYDGFGESGGEAPAASGWRNFAPLVGSAIEIGPNQFFPVLRSQSYLWSYACGGGGSDYASMYEVGRSADFANNNVQTVFTMLFGSYFGDWDSTNNFMRAALASPGHALAAVWAGSPHWFLHHMALGEPIGYSTRLTQNNNGFYQPDDFKRFVHIALMGDPTLRMHVVAPPSGLTAANAGSDVLLEWEPSPDDGVMGYHVYRSQNLHGPFVRINTGLIRNGTAFLDSNAAGRNYSYMVRAIKLESSPSGSYLNASQGIFVSTAPQFQTASQVVLRSSNRQIAIWRISGASAASPIVIGSLGSKWRLGAIADLNGDSQLDYLWQYPDGRLTLWLMNGMQRVSSTSLPAVSKRWRLVGVGDFNGDGFNDILFQHVDGRLVAWLMQGLSRIGHVRLPTAKAAWKGMAVGDFNGDSRPDILFQHWDGRMAIWLMNGTTRIGKGSLTGPDASWSLIGAHDINDDGRADILFQRKDGRLAVWFMNGLARSSAMQLISPSEQWKAMGVFTPAH